jgi:hypothetical protein
MVYERFLGRWFVLFRIFFYQHHQGAREEAENIWKFAQKFIEIDFQKKKASKIAVASNSDRKVMSWTNFLATNSWNLLVRHSLSSLYVTDSRKLIWTLTAKW